MDLTYQPEKRPDTRAPDILTQASRLSLTDDTPVDMEFVSTSRQVPTRYGDHDDQALKEMCFSTVRKSGQYTAQLSDKRMQFCDHDLLYATAGDVERWSGADPPRFGLKIEHRAMLYTAMYIARHHRDLPTAIWGAISGRLSLQEVNFDEGDYRPWKYLLAVRLWLGGRWLS
jgi:hypothetical protein